MDNPEEKAPQGQLYTQFERACIFDKIIVRQDMMVALLAVYQLDASDLQVVYNREIKWILIPSYYIPDTCQQQYYLLFRMLTRYYFPLHSPLMASRLANCQTGSKLLLRSFRLVHIPFCKLEYTVTEIPLRFISQLLKLSGVRTTSCGTSPRLFTR